MTARLWTALVLLAGVFALHGVLCIVAGADSPSAHGAGSVVVAAPAAHHGSTAASGLFRADGEADGAGTGIAGALAGHPATVGVAGVPADAGHGGAPHDALGHLWTVCLAVLAAGLAVLLTVLAPRLARVVPRRVGTAPVRVAAEPAPLRPPDLSALCLLRI